MLARNLCKTLFMLLVSAFAVAVQQAPAPHVVDLIAPDGLKLKGTFFAAAASGPGVLLLHQCNRQRKVWDDLAERLRSEEHTSELQSQSNLVCRLLLEKKKNSETTTRLQLLIKIYLAKVIHVEPSFQTAVVP